MKLALEKSENMRTSQVGCFTKNIITLKNFKS